ncbi:hypothetical protein UlMin_008026 [Ulmus minor]
MVLRSFTLFAIFVFAILPQIQGDGAFDFEVSDQRLKPSSPFSKSLENLQKEIGYTFKTVGLLRRALTHASFSEESSLALSVLGIRIIETSVSLQYLQRNIDISAKELNLRISKISNVESSCAVDGMRLGLQNIVRVSTKTNSTAPRVVCGAFRAIFGAIAVDTGNPDDAGNVFWAVHGGKFGEALAF